MEEGALREWPPEGGDSEPAPRPFLPHWGPGGAGGQCEGLGEATEPFRAEGGEVGTPGQPSVRLPRLIPRTQYPSHRSRSEPGDSRGSALRGDSPPQGALTFFGRTRPLRLSRGGGESGRNGAGATGCRGLRLLHGVQSVEKQVRPHRILPPEAAGITSSHGQSPAGRHRGLSERLQGEVDPWEPRLGPTPGPHRPLIRGGVPPQDPANTTQGRAPPWDPTDHCSPGAHPGTPQTTAQGRAPPHPVLLELLQLRVLIGTSETVR